MADRELYWGASDDPATEYKSRDSDPTGGGDFIVVERADGSEVLLKWDDTAGEWVPGGPINMDGQDVTSVGTLDSDTLTFSGGIESTATSANRFDFDRLSVANGSTEPVLLSGGPVALLLVVGVGEGDSAIFATRGGLNDVSEVADPNDSYSTTQGTAGTNVYYDGTEYVIENNTGSTADYDAFVFS